MLDFRTFESYLRYGGHVDKAKQMITPANSKCHDRTYGGVVTSLCWFGPDDPDLLHHFISLGATIELDSIGTRKSPLHLAARHDKPRLVRALIDLGVPVNIRDAGGVTPLYETFYWSTFKETKSSKILLSAGAKQIDNVGIHVPNWFFRIVTERENMRASCIVLIGLPKCGSNALVKDVLRIIARCVWATQ